MAQLFLAVLPNPPATPSPPGPQPPRIPQPRLLPFTLSPEVPTLSGSSLCHCLLRAIPSATMNPMTTRDFKVFLEPDADYGGYVVVCPSIPGCYSQGKTVPEALANIREAIDLCIEDMESRGEEIPDPNNVLIGSVVVTR